MLTEGTREESLDILKGRIYSAKELIIVDKYLFHGNNIEEIINVLPKELKKILIITEKDIRLETTINSFKSKLNNISINILYTNHLHDRLWIVNKKKYLISGTSFNGLGKKLSFFYTLKEEESKKRVNEYFEEKINSNQEINGKNKKIYLEFFKTLDTYNSNQD